MQNGTKDRRIRPLVLGTLTCLFALIGGLVWMYRTNPRPASTPAGEVASAAGASEAEPTDPNPPADTTPAVTNGSPTLEQAWGIQVAGVSLTNRNTAVYVRYTVVAPEKIALLNGAQAEVYLVDEATGAKLQMITPPRERNQPMGVPPRTMRRMAKQAGGFPPAPSRVLAGRSYSLLIPNWDQALQAGSKVAMVVGKARANNLTVE